MLSKYQVWDEVMGSQFLRARSERLMEVSQNARDETKPPISMLIKSRWAHVARVRSSFVTIFGKGSCALTIHKEYTS